MKCPLFFIGHTIVVSNQGNKTGDCLKEGCAWWHADDIRCYIATICRQSTLIKQLLLDIRDKIPRGGKP